MDKSQQKVYKQKDSTNDQINTNENSKKLQEENETLKKLLEQQSLDLERQLENQG